MGVGSGVRIAGAAVLAASLLLSTGAPGAAGGKYWVRTKEIAPGVTWTRINYPGGPNRVHVVAVEMAQPSTLDVMLAGDRLAGFERTSSMAWRAGALVAINGDYAAPTGRPVFAFARDGVLEQTALAMGRNFAVDRAETTGHMGFLRARAWLTDVATGVETRIARVNSGVPALDEVALFTASARGLERPPENACSARLYRTAGPRSRTPEPGVAEDVYVEAVKCKATRMGRKGGMVVAAPQGGSGAAAIASLLPGQQFTLSWSLRDLVDVVETIGGNPTLVEGGEVVWGNVEGSGRFFARHPRTGVGTTSDGRVLLVTVDGRQEGYSVGMTLKRFARLFRDLGATWALNLDGGGSTTMWVDGRVRNRPSDGTERPVSSALVLLPGTDQGEATLTPDGGGDALPPLPRPVAAGAWGRIVSDPASTGGLLDALERGGARLPASFERIAERFRRR